MHKPGPLGTTGLSAPAWSLKDQPEDQRFARPSVKTSAKEMGASQARIYLPAPPNTAGRSGCYIVAGAVKGPLWRSVLTSVCPQLFLETLWVRPVCRIHHRKAIEFGGYFSKTRPREKTSMKSREYSWSKLGSLSHHHPGGSQPLAKGACVAGFPHPTGQQGTAP